MATAAKTVVAEVDEIVEVGALDPEIVVTPHLYVTAWCSRRSGCEELIARRAARLLKSGWVVNLGIGIPTLVSKYVDEGVVFLHSENGVLASDRLPLRRSST